MPAYESAPFDPPAPVARVTLRLSGNGPFVDNVPLLIDTGADVTLLPRLSIETLSITPDPTLRYELVGFDGSRSFADAVDLEMIFANKLFRGRYLLTDAEHGVLGRDVLNILCIQFDGPGLEWSVVKR